MLALVIAKQELLPSRGEGEASDEEEALGPTQDVESEERGEIRPPLPLLSRTLNDHHSEEGDEETDEAAETERGLFEVTSGEFVIARLDIAGVVRRQWAERAGAGAAAATVGGVAAGGTPRLVRTASGWRFTISGAP